MNKTLLENILCIAGGFLIAGILLFYLTIAGPWWVMLLLCLGIASTGYLTYRAIRYAALKDWLEKQQGTNEAIVGTLSSIADVVSNSSEIISDTREKMGKGFIALGDALKLISLTRNTTKK